MKAISKIMILAGLVSALVSCNAFAAKPTETPVPTATALPTLTPTPAPTDTPVPTATSSPTPTPTPEPTITPTPTEKPTGTPEPQTATPTVAGLPLPSGTPAASWGGIPVMPGALAGAGDSTGYSYTIKTSPNAASQYYQREMVKLGWKLFASGQGKTNAVLLIFMKGADTVTVSILPQSDGLVYVMFVK
jgi:hypothetical protein